MNINCKHLQSLMSTLYPAIVVASYNRPMALERLLRSIGKADYSGYNNIPLVISIDGGGDPQCAAIAEQFPWERGEKRVITHPQNLGLKQHILSCGDLTQQYGAIIMLEEDTFVSPYFYDYSVQTTSYYQADENIAGVSLYIYRFHEYANIAHFMPIHNGYDTFFMQVPSSCGQTWTAHQWSRFCSWYQTHAEQQTFDGLPDSVQQWSHQTSWKVFFYAYMVACDKYFVYPYVGFSVNMGDIGQHMDIQMNVCQNLLAIESPISYNYLPFSFDTVVYDAYMELLPAYFWRHGFHKGENFCVNIYGSKINNVQEPYMLSLLPCSTPIETFGTDLIPVESNVLLSNMGDKVSYGKTADFSKKDVYDMMEQLGSIYHSRLLELGKTLGRVQGVNQIKASSRYRIGNATLYPIVFLRKIYKQIITKIRK